MKKILFTLCLILCFFFSYSNNTSNSPDLNCSVTIDVIQGGNCFQANPTGIAPFTYQWIDNSTQSSTCISGNWGEYCVTITDANGCASAACIVLDDCDVTLSVDTTSSGTAISTAATGIAPFTYSWSNGQTSSSILPTSSGSYCVTITDVLGCTSDECIAVTIGSGNNCIASVINSPNSNCFEAVSYGTAPFTYQWTTGSTDSMACANSWGDTICVTITDAVGCVSTSCGAAWNNNNCSVNILSSNQYLYTSQTGVGPYIYQWSNGFTTSTSTAQSSGTYCVTVTDANGCEAYDCIEVTLGSNCEVYASNVPGTNCLEAVGFGTAPFTYSWTNGSVDSVTCSNIQGDTICVTMTDATGCVATACGAIWNNTNCAVTLTIDSSASLGTLVYATGTGVGALTYNWSNGQSNSTIIPQSSGSYCVTITDTNNCIAEACIDVFLGDTCEVSVQNTSMTNCLEATAIGTAPFTYSWTNGSTSSVACSNNQTDTLCVTVTDAMGCVSTNCGVVWNNTNCSVELYVDTLGTSTTINAVATGIGQLTFLWSDGQTSSSTTPQFSGDYCVTITDSNGCTSEACIAVTINPNNNCAVVLTTDTSSVGTTIYATGTGVGALNYYWSNGQTGSSIIPQSSGTYCVTVTDNNNCSAYECIAVTISVNNNCVVFVLNIPGSNCLQAVPFGTAPFTYLWTDGSIDSMTCSSNIGDSICVTVTDALGCVSTSCGVVWNNTNCDIMLYTDSTNPSGGITIFASGTGVGPFTYQWSNGQVSIDSSLSIQTSGTYCVTITDSNNCIAEGCITVNVGGSNTNCSVDLSPIINSNCLHAVPLGTAPFTYLWDDGSTANIGCASTSGDTLCVTIVDATGCIATACEVVNVAPTCDVFITNSGTTLTANASGNSAAGFSYQWSNGQNTQTITPSASGSYCVTITDSNGCTADACTAFTFISDDIVNGFIILDSLNTIPNGVNTFKVYLIEHDDVAGTLTAVDSQLVTSTPNIWAAEYEFTGVADGDYLIKVVIQTGSDQYDNFLPTYAGDVLFWNDATTVTVPSFNNTQYITMIMGINPGGPGFIGGLIADGANITTGQVETRGDGDPVQNVNVLILTEADVPIIHAATDANGEFTFPSLAYGTYKVIVDVIGLEQGMKFVTLSPENPGEQIYFEMNETFVTKIDDVLNGASLKVYPNPVTEIMNVQIEMKATVLLNVSVTNLLGERLISENKQLTEGIQNLNVNLKDLPAGIYFLNLSDGHEVISHKIMKQ